MTPTLAQPWWRQPHNRHAILIAVTCALTFGLIAAFALDYVVWALLNEREYRESDKFRLLKAAGYLPTWFLMGAALVLMDWPRKAIDGLGVAMRRGVLLVVSATAGGLSSELLKLVLRRERPPKPPHGEWTGLYHWIGFDDADHVLSTAGLSMPSSHSSIAFGACWMLCLLFPRATPVWLFVAAGCATTRLLDHAHHLSDVYVSMITSGMIAVALWAWYEHMLVVWRRADDAALLDAVTAGIADAPVTPAVEVTTPVTPTPSAPIETPVAPAAPAMRRSPLPSGEGEGEGRPHTDAAPEFERDADGLINDPDAMRAPRTPRDPAIFVFIGAIIATALLLLIGVVIGTMSYWSHR
ncbi:MAG: phosphatase PAP2 family protein [Phycisphaera sp.]|nr:phosphatase PAP2 family protein [Phycisphaera sp.]